MDKDNTKNIIITVLLMFIVFQNRSSILKGIKYMPCQFNNQLSKCQR